MDNQPITLDTGEQLDPKIVKVMKGIRQVETGQEKDPYNAVGDNGNAHGAYQFNEKTGMGWKTYAKTYLGDENAPMTPANQNKAMYGYIKEKRDAGFQPEEIAALHNGAKKDPTTGKYTFNNPEYGTKFRQAITGQTPIQSNVQQNQPQEESILQKRGADIGGGLKVGAQGISDIVKGNVAGGVGHLASSALQTVGGVAGALGDVVNKGLELIPGVKMIEDTIGTEISALANTDTGKSVIKSVTDWSKQHPELAKDMEATFNIVTAIPILKGLGVAKNVVLDSASLALKGAAEKAATADLTEVLSRTIGGKRALETNPTSLKTIIDNRIMPEIENGRYATKETASKLEDLIEQKDNVLDKILTSETKSGVKPVVSLNEMRSNALASAEKTLEGQGNYKSVVNKINELFDTAQNSKKAVRMGDDYFMNLKDTNFFKRQARKGLTWDDTVGRDAGFHVGQSYMQGIENAAKQGGLNDVHLANQELAELLKADNLLKYIDNKPVKLSGTGKFLRTVGTEGGAFGGGLIAKGLGMPEVATTFLGGSGGRYLGGKTGGLIRGATESILKRTGKNAVRTTAKETLKKTAGMITTSAITHPKKKK